MLGEVNAAHLPAVRLRNTSRANLLCCSGSKVVIIIGDGLPRARSNAAGRIVTAARKAGAASIMLVSPAGGGLGGILGAFRVAADTSASGDARFSRPENQVPLQLPSLSAPQCQR